jgi:hypothetical protein
MKWKITENGKINNDTTPHNATQRRTTLHNAAQRYTTPHNAAQRPTTLGNHVASFSSHHHKHTNLAMAAPGGTRQFQLNVKVEEATNVTRTQPRYSTPYVIVYAKGVAIGQVCLLD